MSLSKNISPNLSGSEGRSVGAMVRIWAGPACFTKEGALPAVSVVPEAVLDETKRLRSSLVFRRMDG